MNKAVLIVFLFLFFCIQSTHARITHWKNLIPGVVNIQIYNILKMNVPAGTYDIKINLQDPKSFKDFGKKYPYVPVYTLTLKQGESKDIDYDHGDMFLIELTLNEKDVDGTKTVISFLWGTDFLSNYDAYELSLSADQSTNTISHIEPLRKIETKAEQITSQEEQKLQDIKKNPGAHCAFWTDANVAKFGTQFTEYKVCKACKNWLLRMAPHVGKTQALRYEKAITLCKSPAAQQKAPLPVSLGEIERAFHNNSSVPITIEVIQDSTASKKLQLEPRTSRKLFYAAPDRLHITFNLPQKNEKGETVLKRQLYGEKGRQIIKETTEWNLYTGKIIYVVKIRATGKERYISRSREYIKHYNTLQDYYADTHNVIEVFSDGHYVVWQSGKKIQEGKL